MILYYQWIATAIFWTIAVVLCDDETPCDDDNDGIQSHHGECQLYYDCRYAYLEVPHGFSQHLFECPHLFLYSEKTKRCEWFEFVDCGDRKVPISGCDYRANKDPNRKPCILDFPHCEGLPDGPNVIEAKIFTSSFAVCYKDRFLYEGKCPNDRTGEVQIFDPNTRKCIPEPW